MVIDLSPVLRLTFIVMVVVSYGSKLIGREWQSFYSDSPSNPDLSRRSFDVMVVLTVLTGRTKLIVKN